MEVDTLRIGHQGSHDVHNCDTACTIYTQSYATIEMRERRCSEIRGFFFSFSSCAAEVYKKSRPRLVLTPVVPYLS